MSPMTLCKPMSKPRKSKNVRVRTHHTTPLTRKPQRPPLPIENIPWHYILSRRLLSPQPFSRPISGSVRASLGLVGGVSFLGCRK